MHQIMDEKRDTVDRRHIKLEITHYTGQMAYIDWQSVTWSAEICIPSVCDPNFLHFHLRHQRFEALPGSVDAKLTVGRSAVPSYEITTVQMSRVQSGHTVKYREIIQILPVDVIWILRW